MGPGPLPAAAQPVVAGEGAATDAASRGAAPPETLRSVRMKDVRPQRRFARARHAGDGTSRPSGTRTLTFLQVVRPAPWLSSPASAASPRRGRCSGGCSGARETAGERVGIHHEIVAEPRNDAFPPSWPRRSEVDDVVARLRVFVVHHDDQRIAFRLQRSSVVEQHELSRGCRPDRRLDEDCTRRGGWSPTARRAVASCFAEPRASRGPVEREDDRPTASRNRRRLSARHDVARDRAFAPVQRELMGEALEPARRMAVRSAIDCRGNAPERAGFIRLPSHAGTARRSRPFEPRIDT